MDKAIKNWENCLKAHMEAQRADVISKDTLKKTRHALLLAREEMRDMERQVLEDHLRDL